MKVLLPALFLGAVVMGYFCWDYYREWKIRHFYETKAWKQRSKKYDTSAGH